MKLICPLIAHVWFSYPSGNAKYHFLKIFPGIQVIDPV